MAYLIGRARIRRVARSFSYLAPPVLWMAILFVLSSDLGSSPRTEGVLDSLLLRLFPWLRHHLSLAALDVANHWLRKTAHVVAYFLLGLLNLRAAGYLEGRRSTHGVLMAWTAAVLYSLFDEWHQSFIPSRSPEAGDAGIDALGATLAVLICLYQWHRKRTPDHSGSSR
ncbi:MAG: VanZ family protein [Armatimonadetes bacterium]|nr:VanZ family protein [Armatimonadota bacterium]